MTLDAYAQQDCTLKMDFQVKVEPLLRDLSASGAHPSSAADTLSSMSKLLDDAAAKVEELGDPPNGEGEGGAKAGADMIRSMAKDYDRLATAIRTAETDDELEAAFDEAQQVFSRFGPLLREYQQKYPTPELDEAEKAIPGCTDAG
jgi:hypothetical protein